MTPIQLAQQKLEKAKTLLREAHEQTKRKRAALRKALAEAEAAEREEEELIKLLDRAENELAEEREREVVRKKELEDESTGRSERERAAQLAAQEQWKRSFEMGERHTPKTGVFKRKRGASNSPPPEMPSRASVDLFVGMRKIAKVRSGSSARVKKTGKKSNDTEKSVVDEEAEAEQMTAWTEYQKESELHKERLAKRRRTQGGSGHNSLAYRAFMSG